MSDRVLLITGASSGIGAATARAAAQAGFRLILAARRKDKLDELVSELGGRACHYFRLHVFGHQMGGIGHWL